MIDNITKEMVWRIFDTFLNLALTLIICFLICFCSIFYTKYKVDENERWKYFGIALRKKLLGMIMLFVGIVFLTIFLEESFSVNIFELLHVSKWWKLLAVVWIINHIISGKKLYEEINFKYNLQEIKKREFGYRTTENIMLDIESRYNSNYVLQVERLGLLKSLTPVSLIPLIFGYILEGKELAIDWNWYTVVFFSILFIYFYNLWKCYKNMQFWKDRELEVQSALRDIQSKKLKLSDNL